MSDDRALSQQEKRSCVICGNLLSCYNKTAQCHHHRVNERRYLERRWVNFERLAQDSRKAQSEFDVRRARRQEVAEKILTNARVRRIPVLPVERMIYVTCIYFYVSKHDLRGISRKKEIVYVRQLFCYLLKKHTDLSLGRIGRVCRRDHTTVLHAVKKVEENLSVYESDIAAVEALFLKTAPVVEAPLSVGSDK